MRFTHAASRLFFVLRLLMPFLFGTDLAAGQRYSQIVLPFPDERLFSYSYEAKDRSVVIEFQKTHPEELEPINTYDESVIRRVIIKDLGGQGSEVKLILRDENVRVMINSFKEPFRITLDFFDADYQQGVDPKTGLPSIPLARTAPAHAAPNASHTAATALGSLEGKPMSLSAHATPPSTNAENPAMTVTVSRDKGNQRKLLIPNSDASIRTAQDLIGRINETAEGVGHAWKTYPPYIYRVQTANLKTGKNYDSWMKQNASKAINSHEAMSQYAGQLFDFGHESRALLVYQKILHENPVVFEKQPDAIWKLAEIHLGQGNLSLANGYYEVLQAKHPDSPISGLAALRRLDIKAIRASQQQKEADLSDLAPQLRNIPMQDKLSIQSHVALRRAFWGIDAAEIKRLFPDYAPIPNINPTIAAGLEDGRKNADSPRTAFMIDSILLWRLIHAESWNAETAGFAGTYFDRYKGQATEPYRPALLAACEESLLKSTDKNLKEKQFTNVVGIIESLPKSMNVLLRRPNVAWAAGESYRRLQQPQSAVPHYENALAATNHKPDQFKAAFWLEQSLMSSMGLASIKGKGNGNLATKLRSADQKTWDAWQTLNPEEKQVAFSEVQNELEQNIKSSILVKSSPRILLEMLGQNLATTTPVPDSAVNGSANTSQPTVKMIRLLADLSKRFTQLGLGNEKKKARQLQRNVDIKLVKDDRDAMKIWTDELTTLAEEHRQANDYLEAGRLFTLTGSSNNQWEGRAEALYKGGLLLYRSGRRDEALAAFKEAADDGNNILYAELAKKRLEQLQQ